MLGAIRQLDGARIGRPKKWDKIARKVRADEPLSAAEAEYYARLTRIYRRPATGAPAQELPYRAVGRGSEAPVRRMQ